MTPRATRNPKSTLIESVALAHQLHLWKPFQLHHQALTLEGHTSKPYFFSTKKPCRSDRSTTPAIVPDPLLDLSRLSLREDPSMACRTREDVLSVQESYKKWFARKRRRRGSRSVSGRSSDRSVTRVTLMSAATCSDSSGELMSWGSDVSEVRIPRRQEGRGDKERNALGLGFEKEGGLGFEKERGGESKGGGEGNESGYGSEPGYRGDGEFGYGDEFDDDDEFDSGRFLLWADRRIAKDVNMRGIEGENKIGELKSHHRCRRKKHDWRVMAS